jgi:hypothetical protein
LLERGVEGDEARNVGQRVRDRQSGALGVHDHSLDVDPPGQVRQLSGSMQTDGPAPTGDQAIQAKAVQTPDPTLGTPEFGRQGHRIDLMGNASPFGVFLQ